MRYGSMAPFTGNGTEFFTANGSSCCFAALLSYPSEKERRRSSTFSFEAVLFGGGTLSFTKKPSFIRQENDASVSYSERSFPTGCCAVPHGIGRPISSAKSWFFPSK